MTDYEKLSREVLAQVTGFQIEAVRSDIISGFARALERVALEARIEGIDWCAEQVDPSVVFAELDALRSKLVGLDAVVNTKK